MGALIIKENKFKSFIKNNVVMIIAMTLAIVTSFIVPPSEEYLSYFDYKTLTCLFCTLAVVCALKDINFFYILAHKIINLFKNTRNVILALVYITFIGSMLIANDMALITFLPLGYLVLHSSKKEKYMAISFILQNIAANLGGMLTPFGNPQNLYLYSKFNIPTLEFLGIMIVPFIVSIILLTLSIFLFVKKEDIEVVDETIKINPPKTIFDLLLFLFSILIVFRIIPFWVGLIVIPISLIITDRHALKIVDYPLLLTFIFFFIFSGNMSRIDFIRNFLTNILDKSTLLVSTISCQFISNVPTAILLSNFTQNYKELLLGVNIGGVGTIISSLASLITFREYLKHNKGKGLYYIGLFSLFNFSFLLILLLVSLLII